jgi:hypothetical protein
MRFYSVQGTITRTVDGWTSTRQIPTFYLNSDVQGILTEEGAKRVADDIVATIVGRQTEGVEWSLLVIQELEVTP